MAALFRIKICGVTTVEDAVAVVQAGADAVGVNFHPPSPRCVTESRAREIAAVLPADVTCVGVYVNPTPEQLGEAVALGLHAVQLHGNELPSMLAEFRELPIIKAFRVDAIHKLGPVQSFLAETKRLQCLPAMVLLDASTSGAFGGTGATADWSIAAQYASLQGPPLVLAGGLTADNVAGAIRTVRPVAVDAASGVESIPGRKDESKVRAFVQAAESAFRAVSEGNPA